ncbi:hypothetical protein T492DRAFT_955581 [Pavlovales sp. CCMP2436]|nr:hypothetical protein T492DRAFT_955581 [Pavlovales sp. CCMP2436]
MLAILEPMHAQLDAGAHTESEAVFDATYGPTLRAARERCEAYLRTGSEAELRLAWERYYQESHNCII